MIAWRASRRALSGGWTCHLYGAIGAALMSDGDLQGALAKYEEAVRLRRGVVDEDPSEDFAKTALSRGYERLATIHGRLGNLGLSFDFGRQGIAVMRRRLEAHPERENVWREYGQTTLAAVGKSLDLLESQTTTPRVRRTRAPEVAAMIDQLALVRERWIREKRSGVPVPSDDDLRLVRERLGRLQSQQQ